MPEPHKFVLNLSQELDFGSPNKYVALQNSSIYQTWKNIKEQSKNDKVLSKGLIQGQIFNIISST